MYFAHIGRSRAGFDLHINIYSRHDRPGGGLLVPGAGKAVGDGRPSPFAGESSRNSGKERDRPSGFPDGPHKTGAAVQSRYRDSGHERGIEAPSDLPAAGQLRSAIVRFARIQFEKKRQHDTIRLFSRIL